MATLPNPQWQPIHPKRRGETPSACPPTVIQPTLNQLSNDHWEICFQALIAYKDKKGHANPPLSKSSSDADFKLAVWLSNQRRCYGNELLATDKAQKLKDIGCSGFEKVVEAGQETQGESAKGRIPTVKQPLLNRTSTHRRPWETRFLELMAYKNKNGHANPQKTKKSSLSAADYSLALWLKHQREAYRGEKLSLEKIQKLKDLGCIGFDTDSKTEQHQRISASWYTHFLELMVYKGKNGHANPQKSVQSSEADCDLAVWLNDQRHLFQIGLLARNKVQKLKDLGCEGLELVRRFDNGTNRNCSTPSYPHMDENVKSDEQLEVAPASERISPHNLHCQEDPNSALEMKATGEHDINGSSYPWSRSQQQSFEKRKNKRKPVYVDFPQTMQLKVPDKAMPTTSTKGRSIKCMPLTAVQSTLNQISMNENHWENHFWDLVAYKDKKGHANPPLSEKTSDADFKLAVWLSNQRRYYGNGLLATDKAQKLEAIGCSGFEIAVPTPRKRSHKQTPWRTRFMELVAYKNQNGHANPPKSRNRERVDHKLSVWLQNQRQQYREGKLVLEKLQKLKDLGCSGFDPDSKGKQQQANVIWETHFTELVAYKERNGHANPARSQQCTSAGYKLAYWLNRQRHAHREGKLVLEKLQKLKDLGCSGFDPDSKGKHHQASVIWETHFTELVAYKEQNGHANPARSQQCTSADYKLASWLNRQRHAHRKGKLVQEKIQMLKDHGCHGFDLDAKKKQNQQVN